MVDELDKEEEPKEDDSDVNILQILWNEELPNNTNDELLNKTN